MYFPSLVAVYLDRCSSVRARRSDKVSGGMVGWLTATGNKIVSYCHLGDMAHVTLVSGRWCWLESATWSSYSSICLYLTISKFTDIYIIILIT